jgi:acylphosphatase
MIRRRYVFYGSVQGVGFRWRAMQAAKLYGLTGWVRNEWDGSVTMELQGEEKLLNKVILLLQNSRYIYVDRIDTEDLMPDLEERSFRTDYDW